MSRIGKSPIQIPSGVTVTAEPGRIAVKGPKGELTGVIPAAVAAQVEGAKVVVTRTLDDKHTRALHGTTRSLIANMIEGVQKGFSKELEIQGVGFRAQVQGRRLILALGYSHPIEFDIPDGVKVDVADGTKMTVSGADKQLIGLVSARIRGYFKAEPYKGKGIRYKGEYVRRKAGKTVA